MQFRVPVAVDSPAKHAEGGNTSGQASQTRQVDVEAGSQRAGAGDKELLSQLGKLLGRYNELRSAYDQLQAQRDDLIAGQDELSANHKSELAAALRGELAPLNAQIEQLKSELQSACEERDHRVSSLRSAETNFLSLALASAISRKGTNCSPQLMPGVNPSLIRR